MIVSESPRIELYNTDCITGMASLPPASVDLIVTSIPFEELFTYSGKPEDVGNNGSTVDIREGRFALNMRFVVEQMFRVLRPGSNACIHIQQLLAYKIQHGFMGRRDFRGAMVEVFTRGGGIETHATLEDGTVLPIIIPPLAADGRETREAFNFVGEFVIPKNPQAMSQRLNLHSLQFKTGYARDSSMLAPAVNDYVLIFRKPGTHPSPPHAVSYRNKNPRGWVTEEEWIRWASGIWADILEIDVLDGARGHKEQKQEKHVCLARGSLVLTRDGHKPIEDVAIGDMVLTHRGRWRPVIAKQCNGVKSVIRTTAQGVADLRTTPDHRLWVRSCLGRGGKGRLPGTNSPTLHRHNATSASPDWMEAKDTLGSYVNLPLPPVEESPLSVADWWLIGRYLGDGHLDARGRPHISCRHDEAEELISRMGRRAGFVAKRATATQVAVKDRCGQRSTDFTAILKKCGRGATGKLLPAEALALDIEKSEALLSGYLSADGHFVKQYQRWTASSVSRPLLLGMAMIAQRARGVVASVYAGRPAGTCVIEGRTVRTNQDWILGIPPKNLSAFLADDGAWKKVREISNAGEAEVWDLQVEEDASFVAEGCVVHNCPLQLEVIRRCVALYTNPVELQPDVTVLDPFMGIGSTAYVCAGGASPVTRAKLAEPRNVVGFELKESYHRASVAYVTKVVEEAKREAAPDLFSGVAVAEAA